MHLTRPCFGASLLLLSSAVIVPVGTEAGTATVNDHEQVDLYRSDKFAIGVGTAIVVFDTKLKFTNKKNGLKIFVDPEGNLDLPEVSRVTTFYGGYSFNNRHSISFSYFTMNRESSLIDVDLNYDLGENNVNIFGQVTLADQTSFYQLNYGYSLFNDARSKILLNLGIYSLDLVYIFDAEGEITINGTTKAGAIHERADVFAPLPLVGLDFFFSFTKKWSMAAKVAFVTGHYQDVSAIVLQTGLNAQYKFSSHIGGVIGLTNFNAAVDIEDNEKKQEISYSYGGLFIGMHFVF